MLYFPSFMSQRGTYGSSSSPTASPSVSVAPGGSGATGGSSSGTEELGLVCYQQPDQMGRNSYHVLHKLVHPPALGGQEGVPSDQASTSGFHASPPSFSHHPHPHLHQQGASSHRGYHSVPSASSRLTLAPTSGAFAALDGLVLPESTAFRQHHEPLDTAPSSSITYPGVAGSNHLYAAALRHRQDRQKRASASPEDQGATRRRKRARASLQGTSSSSTWQPRQPSTSQARRSSARPKFSLGPPAATSSEDPSPSAVTPVTPAAAGTSAATSGGGGGGGGGGGSSGVVKCSVHCRAEAGDVFCSRSTAAMMPCPDSPPDHDCIKVGCERVTLNVSGMHFETRRGILERHPNTLLGNGTKRKPYFDSRRREYFFDRHRPTFEAIFNYYQYGGKIKRPNNVPDDIFLSELEFYEIEKEVIDTYKRDEGYVIENVVLPDNPFKRRVWMLFEYPETSTTAFFIAVSSVIFTVISIILFCVETLPVFATSHCVSGEAPNFLDPFFIVESMCTFWFTLEVIVRFFVCPSIKAYMKDLKNAVDLAAIVPYYVTLFNVLLSFSCEGAKGSASLAFLRVIRLIRVFKLTKHSAGLQVLVLTFRASIEGLSLFLVALIVCILVFSSTIYYVEADNKNSSIESIPDAFWWAIITMCTVGYGDKVPKGPLGKLVGGCCALAGVLTLAIPVPIITENFNKFYTHKTGRGKH